MAEIKDLSTTDANNTGTAANAGFPENMAYSDVNNAARALEGMIARLYADTNGTVTTTGSSNAYLLTPNQTVAAYAAGDSYVFKASFTNTGAVTINVSSIGAKSIVKPSGDALASGEITSGGLYSIIYDGTNFQLQGADDPENLTLTSLTVTGSTALNGNTTIGDAASDTVTITADVASDLIPSADGTHDLGAVGSEWQDLFINGTANIDSLVADTADIDGGTVDGAVIGGASAAAGTFTTLVANTSVNIAGDGATVTGIKDEDNMASDSATKLATQQSIKAYVDSQVTAQDLDVTDGSTSIDIDLDSESLGILGGTGIDSSASGTGVTLSIDSTVATLTGSQTLTNKTLTTPVIAQISNSGTLTLPTSTDTIVGRDTSDTLTNKTLTSAVLNTSVTGSAVLDEDDLSSDSSTQIATQQSIKAYVDSQVTAQDLDVTDGSSSIDIDLDSESLGILGGTGIDSTASGTGVTLAIDSTVATLTGSQTLTNKTLTAPVISTISNTGTITLPTSTDTLVGKATTDTLTNKTLTSPVLNTGVSGTAVLDEDNMSSDSATQLATQQSIKAYVDSQVTAQDLDVTDGSSSIDIDLDSESLGILGGTGIDSTASGTGVTLAIDSTVATLTGSQTLTNKSLTAPTLTGTAVVASLDISGDIDVDGISNLDVVDIDGSVDMASTLQVDGAITSSAGATITVADNSDVLTLVSTDSDDAFGPFLNLHRNSPNAADNDGTGGITFSGENDNDEEIDYAQIQTAATDVSDGSEDGSFIIQTMVAGTSRDRITLTPSETVVNENSVDLDFRVESDLSTHALFVQASDGNVGIGNSSPTEILTLGTTSDTNNRIAIQSANNGSGTIQFADGTGTAAYAGYINYTHSDDALAFAAGSVEKMRIDSGGLTIVDGSLTFDKPSVYGFQFLHNDAGNDLSIRQGDANNANYETRFNIGSTGNIGIGISPVEKFNIQGTTSVNGASRRNVLILDATSAAAGLGGGISFGGYYSGTSSVVYDFGTVQGFKENSTAGDYGGGLLISTRKNGYTPYEHMRINHHGAMKLSASASTPSYSDHGNIGNQTHEIWQAEPGYGILQCSSASGTTNQYGLMVNFNDDVNNASNWFIRGLGATDPKFYIYSNGDVYTKTGTDIQTISDRRLKDNIEDYSDGLRVLNSLTPRTYTWKEGQGKAGTQYGFVAQEIEESSEVIDNMNLFSIVVPTREDDKNPLQPDDKQYNTQLSAKDALYVSAIQELSKEIELLKEEIKALQNG